MLATREKINDQPEITVSAMEYNELGEMITKYLHSNHTSGTRSFAQKTHYRYNIRGWLTKINAPSLGDDNYLYGMQLFYNSTAGMGGLATGEGLYNGKISGIKWGIKNEPTRGYRFTYDGLNRMLQAKYAEGSYLTSLAARGQTRNGANFSLFWERDAFGILPKKAEVVISGALSLVLSLDVQRKNVKITTPAKGTVILTYYAGNVIYEGGTMSYILTDEGRIIADNT